MTGRKMVLPGATLGIIGGGQLGRMLVLAAKEMGYVVGVLDPQENSPAAQVADWHVQAAYDDQVALKSLAERCQLLTYEFENIDRQALAEISERVAVPQGVALLSLTQNRRREKEFLQEHGFPVVPFGLVENAEELSQALARLGYPAVLKTLEGGYDGHGQVVLQTSEQLPQARALLATAPCILEAWYPFEREVSVMVAANEAGEVSVFPVAENRHKQNILHLSFVPSELAPGVTHKVQGLAKELAATLGLRGILGIEFFVGATGEVVINELAPRPHNSGHYSIEACNFSQFDLHILAICNRPLPPIRLLEPAVMVNILGQHQEAVLADLANHPLWHVHLYGKAETLANRKMGHVTILTNKVKETLASLEKLPIWK